MKKFLKDALMRNTYILISGLTAVSIGLVFAHIKGIEHVLIIHFTKTTGLDFLGSAGDVYGILITGLLLIGLNTFLAVILYERVRFFSYIIAFATLFIALLLCIALGVIISINF